MRGEPTRSTPWVCDGADCGKTEVLTDGYQSLPPKGWRILNILPTTLDMALEPSNVQSVKQVSLCSGCFSAFADTIALDVV